MKISILFILLLFLLSQAVAQERIPQSISISLGHLLLKGGQFTGHYHLNAYDELRLEYAFNNRTFKNDSIDLAAPAILKVKRLSLNYVKGLRPRYGSLNNISIYLGSGLVLGKEYLQSTSTTNESVGIRFFGEVDMALSRKLSLYLRSGNSWMLTKHLGKNGEMAIGLRAYF